MLNHDRKTFYWRRYADLFSKGETREKFEDWLIVQLDQALTDKDYAEGRLDRVIAAAKGEDA